MAPRGGGAEYVPREITVTANGNGGTPATQTKTVKEGTTWGEVKKTLTTPTKTGYNFAGWN